MLPLIRKTERGWERLVIGTAAGGEPRYEAIEWDNAAWQARQQAAEAIRQSLILEQPVGATAQAAMELV